MKLEWIESAGGPLLCATAKVARCWRGISGSSINVSDTDYERACSQTEYASVIACADSSILVLGDEPLASTFLDQGETFLIARWFSCVSHQRALEALTVVPELLAEIEPPVEFDADETQLLLYDSALSFVTPQAGSALSILPGSYTVSTERYMERGVFEFLIHRFTRNLVH